MLPPTVALDSSWASCDGANVQGQPTNLFSTRLTTSLRRSSCQRYPKLCSSCVILTSLFLACRRARPVREIRSSISCRGVCQFPWLFLPLPFLCLACLCPCWVCFGFVVCARPSIRLVGLQVFGWLSTVSRQKSLKCRTMNSILGTSYVCVGAQNPPFSRPLVSTPISIRSDRVSFVSCPLDVTRRSISATHPTKCYRRRRIWYASGPSGSDTLISTRCARPLVSMISTWYSPVGMLRRSSVSYLSVVSARSIWLTNRHVVVQRVRRFLPAYHQKVVLTNCETIEPSLSPSPSNV